MLFQLREVFSKVGLSAVSHLALPFELFEKRLLVWPLVYV